MFTKHLWLLDNSLRKRAILRCYRFSLKQLFHLQDDFLITNLKQMLTTSLVFQLLYHHQNKQIRQLEILSGDFKTFQAFNYVLVQTQTTYNSNIYITKLIRLAYSQTFFQSDQQHAPYLISKLEKFPQYVALNKEDKKYYKYLVQQSIKRQNLPEWQKYKQIHEYLLDKKSEKLDQRLPLDVIPEDLEYIKNILEQKKPYWDMYFNIFQEVLDDQFEYLRKEARPKQIKQIEPDLPTPTYKWKPFNQMYVLRKNEWVTI